MTLNRRHFLGASGAAMLLASCNSSGNPSVAIKQTIEQVGIQTYTLREAMGEDFVGTLQMIKDVGYDYVELNGGNFADRSPSELRTILDDIGLPSPITHIDYDTLASRPGELVDVAGALGCKTIVVPWISEDQRSPDHYKKHAEMLNNAGGVLNAAGIRVGYHNHEFEFFDLGAGQSGMEILLSETDPNLVDFELDLFWAALTGTDIVGLFEKHPGRFKMCHVKDLIGGPLNIRSSRDVPDDTYALMANVGEGDLPFESYFSHAEVAGLSYFIVEHDNPQPPYRAAIETSYNTVKDMRF